MSHSHKGNGDEPVQNIPVDDLRPALAEPVWDDDALLAVSSTVAGGVDDGKAHPVRVLGRFVRHRVRECEEVRLQVDQASRGRVGEGSTAERAERARVDDVVCAVRDLAIYVICSGRKKSSVVEERRTI